MRTSSIISYSALFASSAATALAFSFAAPESFDRSLLNARAALPDIVAMDSSARLVKRAEGPWDCGDDEEYVAYDDQEGEDDGDDNDDEHEGNDAPVFKPAQQQGEVKAVKAEEQNTTTPPPPAATPEVPQQQQPAEQQQQPAEQQQQPAEQQKEQEKQQEQEAAPPRKQADSIPTPAPKSTTTTTTVATPENIADGTYTAEEGCARYHEVKTGDVCLKLVEENKDLGLTLDQLYCLNPAIDDLCYNLWIGTSYCVGYSGEEPLNTGVSSK